VQKTYKPSRVSLLYTLPAMNDTLDPQLKQLMKELGDAINESLSDSEQVSDVVSRIKEGGQDVFLVVEATIDKQGKKWRDKVSVVSTMTEEEKSRLFEELANGAKAHIDAALKSRTKIEEMFQAQDKIQGAIRLLFPGTFKVDLTTEL
jgi:cell division GTPase FtsZ